MDYKCLHRSLFIVAVCFVLLFGPSPDEGASSPSSELKIQQLNKNFN